MTGSTVAVDIGGTFTDVVAAGNGRLEVLKLPTDYGDLTEPVLSGVSRAASLTGSASLGTVIHATTVATNALLEGKGASVGLLITRGFADVLTIGRIRRADPYALSVDRPAPLVRDSLIVEIDERIDADGTVLVPLGLDQVRRAAEKLRAGGAEAVVIAFLHSYRNPVHEQEARAAVVDTLGTGCHVVMSSSVVPEPREYERTSTAVIAAYLAPTVTHYVQRLDQRLRDELETKALWVMKSSGGLSHAGHVIDHPEELVESGPAAGVIAAAAAARSAKVDAAVGFDMGGTTAKAALILDGTPAMNHEYEVGGATHAGDFLHKGTGHPLRSPVIDLAEIGTGGGSIAWLDRAGVLRLGPQSAASEPGPACYGRGGTRPTTTDADLVLGYIGGGSTGLGELRHDLARAAIDTHLATPLGITIEQAAAGVFQLATTQMAEAVRLVSLSKGVDPRSLTLIPSGGAGPVHAWAIARELGMRRLLMSQFPGVASAFGMLYADVRSDRSLGLRGSLSDSAFVAELHRARTRLLDALLVELVSQDGQEHEGTSLRAEVEARYVGQTYTMAVALDDEDGAALAERFHEAHERAYGFRSQHDVEIVALRGTASRPPLAHVLRPAWRPVGGPATRAIAFDGEWFETRVIERADLTDDFVSGPAVVVQSDTTTVVPPGGRVRQNDQGLMEMEMEAVS